ncbi:carbamoyltransferase N-terminal domain-containing protein [Sphingomonas abietis]|uniref:Nodulation protein NodU n=1 Tax=Sphingomonas abietis TaxID=3012344 RepID=A0ABY7NV12_9SPHN|nr:carbamoyltransferase N-terminal domain-containing protein [Sphingomonas abietis]WBO24397.1 nodulation protein NodU [Sphingomonas abietis]
MRICGAGLGHDAAVALIEDGRLVFSVELEKLGNRERFARAVDEPGFIAGILTDFGYCPEDIDILSVDGSDAGLAEAWGPYPMPAIIERPGHTLANIAAAWSASPFAQRREAAHILVWDGSGLPELHHLDPATQTIRHLGAIGRLPGRAYAAAGQYFAAFEMAAAGSQERLDVAGKLMAFVGLGTADPHLVDMIEQCCIDAFHRPSPHASDADRLEGMFESIAMRSAGVSGEDILAAFHLFVEHSLTRGLRRLLGPSSRRNLCIAGGCGLNIKWNSAIRASGLFQHVWVPPFPNNSGAAIGAAAAAFLEHVGFRAIDWSVYSGPSLPDAQGALMPGWRSRPCEAPELARLLAEGAIVALLDGRAEIGPRALGHRSIVAAPFPLSMRDRLNGIKRREPYRPIAPVCILDRAAEVFDPGMEDSYMLFEQRVRPEWRGRIPAVVHIDGTARVQTVERTAPSMIARLLIAYEEQTGIPILCNTSANRPGRGFFPDLQSVLDWGEVDHVWYDGRLFERDRTPGGLDSHALAAVA